MTADQPAPALLPCPFCGSAAEIERDSDHHGAWFNLGCSQHWDRVGPDRACPGGRLWYTEPPEDEAEAIAAWNRRAPSPAMAQPMESAPKDREIMLFARGYWYIGQWDDDCHALKPRPFWLYSALWGKTGCRAVPPVAWMPLPAPPKENDHGHS